MSIIFDYEKNSNISDAEIKETKKKISLIEKKILEKVPQYFEFLEKHEDKGDYVEVHWPIFDYGITIMISKIKEKFLISVLDQRNSKVYGNLFLEGYDCIDIKGLKKLGMWSTWKRTKLSVFKCN